MCMTCYPTGDLKMCLCESVSVCLCVCVYVCVCVQTERLLLYR